MAKITFILFVFFLICIANAEINPQLSENLRQVRDGAFDFFNGVEGFFKTLFQSQQQNPSPSYQQPAPIYYQQPIYSHQPIYYQQQQPIYYQQPAAHNGIFLGFRLFIFVILVIVAGLVAACICGMCVFVIGKCK